MSAIDYFNKNKKIILGISISVIALVISPVVINIVFTYGTYLGTIMRKIAENGICM